MKTLDIRSMYTILVKECSCIPIAAGMTNFVAHEGEGEEEGKLVLPNALATGSHQTTVCQAAV